MLRHMLTYSSDAPMKGAPGDGDEAGDGDDDGDAFEDVDLGDAGDVELV